MDSPRDSTPRTPRQLEPLPANLSDAAASPLIAARERRERGTLFARNEMVFDHELGEAIVHSCPRRAKATISETQRSGPPMYKLHLRDGSIVAREAASLTAFALACCEYECRRQRVWL